MEEIQLSAASKERRCAIRDRTVALEMLEAWAYGGEVLVKDLGWTIFLAFNFLALQKFSGPWDGSC